MDKLILTLTFLALVVPAFAQDDADAPEIRAQERARYTETGHASWYGEKHDGRTTADGSSFDRTEFTAAHRTLKFGTMVQVTNLANHRKVKVRVTDRGPHTQGRIIDVSAAAARELGMQRRGTARVRVSVFKSDQFPD